MRLIFFINLFTFALLLSACNALKSNKPEADKETLSGNIPADKQGDDDLETALLEKPKKQPSLGETATQTNSLEEIQKSFQKEIDGLLLEINSSLKEDYGLESILPIAEPPGSLYQQNIVQGAIEHLQSKYSRAELGLLENKTFIPIPTDEPYEFLSPAGEFLDKNKALYEKLRNTAPYHEQGQLARECGLKKIALADKEFSKGKTQEAGEAYRSAMAMNVIVSGKLPLGPERVFYESCTGKNLLTGQVVSTF